jgi:hypothetical protein
MNVTISKTTRFNTKLGLFHFHFLSDNKAVKGMMVKIAPSIIYEKADFSYAKSKCMRCFEWIDLKRHH